MKKITFKNLLVLALCVFTFQAYAQVDFQSKTFYKLRTAIVTQDDYNTERDAPFPDQFVYPTVRPGQNSLSMTPLNTENPDLQLFAFVELGDQMVEYPLESGQMWQVYNIVSKFDPDPAATEENENDGTGVLELNTIPQGGQRTRMRGNAFPFDDDLAKFIVVAASSDENETSYQIINSATIGLEANANRAIQPDTNYQFLNFQGVDVGALDGPRPRIEQWVFETETGEQVLSNKQFDTSSLSITNPINNNLTIKGLSDNVNEISVFSLLGQKVLTRTVNAESTLSIDVSGLVSGVYLVKLTGDNGSFTKKIIKQ